MKQRDVTIDVIRILACFMVVMMHSPMPSLNANGPFLVALSYFTEPCIGLFFMISGALLLPVKLDYTIFIKRRFGKLVIPTLFWTLVYIGLNLYYGPEHNDLPRTLLSIPFSAQGHGVLWFMYTLLGLYLIAPILGTWLDKARKIDLQIVLGLWVITLCYPLLESCLLINESNTGILYYFTGYAGYFLLGYYLKRYPTSVPKVAVITIAALGPIALLAIKRLYIGFDFYSMFGYLSIFIVALAVSIWILMCWACNWLKINDIKWGGVSLTANLAFGVYLMHIAVMRYWVWNQIWIQSISNYILQTGVIIAITFSISIALCYIIAKTPVGDYIIGYKER